MPSRRWTGNPERFEQRVQHGVGFEAVTASSSLQDAINQRAGLERATFTELHRQVLMWDMRYERPVHCAQTAGVGGRDAGQPDPAQQPVTC